MQYCLETYSKALQITPSPSLLHRRFPNHPTQHLSGDSPESLSIHFPPRQSRFRAQVPETSRVLIAPDRPYAQQKAASPQHEPREDEGKARLVPGKRVLSPGSHRYHLQESEGSAPELGEPDRTGRGRPEGRSRLHRSRVQSVEEACPVPREGPEKDHGPEHGVLQGAVPAELRRDRRLHRVLPKAVSSPARELGRGREEGRRDGITMEP